MKEHFVVERPLRQSTALVCAASGRHVRGIGSSKLKRKFQAALPDSQINKSKVPATSAMYPVSDLWKFDWSCTNRRQMERVLWRLVSWWCREGNWRRLLGVRASTTSFRGCSCHTSDSKSQSHRSWWGPSRTVQSRRRDSTGHNAQNMCCNMGNWRVARGMDVLHAHPTSQERWS